MRDAKKTIDALQYCVAKYGKENSFTFAAYSSLECMKEMQSRIEALEKDSEILRESLDDYLSAQDDLDNREYHGINADPYDKLIRRRNEARDALDTAMQSEKGGV